MNLHHRYVISLSLILGLVILSGCKKDSPPPPRNCGTAEECFSILRDTLGACAFAGAGDLPNRTAFWNAYNFHKVRNILAVVQVRVVHLNTGLPDSISQKPVRVIPLPKGTIRGGPDGIDYNGPPEGLGCQYVKVNNLVDQYSYSLISACFEGDSACVSSPVAQPTGDEIARCDVECSKIGGNCTRADIGYSPGLSSLATALISAPLPTRHDLQSLLQLSGAPSPHCKYPGLIELASDGSFKTVSDGCIAPIPLEDDAPWSAAFLNSPAFTSGKITRATPSEALLTWDTQPSMTIRSYATASAAPVNQSLWFLRVRSNELLFASEKRPAGEQFCAKIAYKQG